MDSFQFMKQNGKNFYSCSPRRAEFLSQGSWGADGIIASDLNSGHTFDKTKKSFDEKNRTSIVVLTLLLIYALWQKEKNEKEEELCQ